MDTEIKVPNAQKWTVEVVKPILRAIYEGVQEQDDVYFIGKALTRQGLYSDIWAYWKKAFADNEDIMETMLQIDTFFETRLMEAALSRKVSPAVAMMILKTKYGYGDKPGKTAPAPEPNNAAADTSGRHRHGQEIDPRKSTRNPLTLRLAGGRLLHSDGCDPETTTMYKAVAVCGPDSATRIEDVYTAGKTGRWVED